MGKDGSDTIVKFLKSRGFSDAAIAEFLKGNPIKITLEELPTPWPATAKKETVYKDGKSQEINPRGNKWEDKTD